MKSRFLIGLLLVSLLVITLGLTGCGKTYGEGVFHWSDEDAGQTTEGDVSFELQAQPVGKAFQFPVGEGQYQVSEFNILNLDYIYFQPARGTVNFQSDSDTEDTSDDLIINGTINGTFYVDPADYESAFGFLPDEGSQYSLYVGPCRVTLGDVKENLYLLTFCEKYDNYGNTISNVGFSIFEEELVRGGRLNLSAVPMFPLGGSVVEGDFTIE